MSVLKDIPLALYIHIPWCVQKCPYCDFNSHQQKGSIPEQEYLAHVLDDLKQESLRLRTNNDIRSISSIFIGGGTPSLLSVNAMQQLLDGVKSIINVDDDAEITMEANPGSVEADKFDGFRKAGINRISVGVQSFQAPHLSVLGRVHDQQQALNALSLARSLSLRSFNLDLMHGLPQQSIENALDDLSCAIASKAPHISWYQLTIEPNTLFHSKPPNLPNDDILWEIQTAGHRQLEQAGYKQYEISAYSKANHQCKHNLNYWRFGDYIGIGCGAHGKITDMSFTITRTEKVKHPKGYMDLTRSKMHKEYSIESQDLCFEFFMNRFRLVEAFEQSQFETYCGRALSGNEKQQINKLSDQGLLDISQSTWQLTSLGRRYLNSVLTSFL